MSKAEEIYESTLDKLRAVLKCKEFDSILDRAEMVMDITRMAIAYTQAYDDPLRKATGDQEALWELKRKLRKKVRKFIRELGKE